MMAFDHYDLVPHQLAQEIIAQRQHEMHDED
jgi:hypothetical protein